jgi:hypothetical protein
VYSKSRGRSARPKAGMSIATPRANGATRLSRSSQSRDEPGLPCTKTTASSASSGPTDDTGVLRPSTSMRLRSTWIGGGGPSLWRPAGISTGGWSRTVNPARTARPNVRVNAASFGFTDREPNAKKPSAAFESSAPPPKRTRSIGLKRRPVE